MSSTIYSLQLARSKNGNWSLTPSDNLPQHPTHPLHPMAFPATMTPSQAQDYGHGIADAAHVPTPATLDWHPHGFTRTQDGSFPAYRAAWSVSVQSLSPAL